MRYTDFTILGTNPNLVKADGRKRLTFDLYLPGALSDPVTSELDIRTLDDLTENASRTEADWTDARALGEALATALLPPSVWNVLNNRITETQAAHEGLRIRLILSGRELNNLPWEFTLFNRGGGEAKVSDFLALMPNVSLVRHAATPLSAPRIEAKLPATILVASASPSRWPKLKIVEESAIVEEATSGDSRLTVKVVQHLQRHQLPDKTNPAHIFHFAGHGQFETQQSSIPGAYEGKASIVLEDEYGDEDVLDAELLAVQLQGRWGPRCRSRSMPDRATRRRGLVEQCC